MPADFDIKKVIPGELREAREYLDTVTIPALAEGDCLTVKGTLWQDEETLQALLQHLETEANKRGAILSPESYLLPAYKEGYFWLTGAALPALAAAGPCGRVGIAYDPLSLAAPGCPPLRENPPRALQDAYPADRRIAEVLGIRREDVTFRPLPEGSGITYLVEGFSPEGEPVFRRSHASSYAAVPYLPADPDAGYCQIARSCIRSSVNGGEEEKAFFLTDAERAVAFVRDEVLPAAEQVLRRAGRFKEALLFGGSEVQQEPLFRLLRLDITLNGPEIRGPEPEDMISAGETIEENLRPMVQTCFRRTLAKALPGARVTAMGGILPAVHVRAGDPEVEAGLYIEALPESGCADAEDGDAAGPQPHPEADALIGYGEYLAWLEEIRKDPEVRVFPVGKTLQGRTLYGVELMPDRGGGPDGRKTVLINGRHHANEVSASNAFLLLLRRFRDDGAFRALAKKVRIVLLPMENADGAALHYERAKEHPEWQFHACYTNSLDTDLMQNYYCGEAPPCCPEAQAFTDLLRDLEPVMIVDCHGVPHHEMGRQFDVIGGSRALWLPRTQMSCFYFHIEDDAFRENKALMLRFQEYLAARYREDDAYVRRSAGMDAVFCKYTPEADPLGGDAADGLLHYYVPSPRNDKHPYPSVRMPQTVRLMLTAEAADETATGEDLRRAAELHERNILAAIDFAAENL